MKVIITESQKNKIIQSIIGYFEESLVPDGGWKTKKEYLDEIEDNGGELFIPLELSRFEESLWYSECENIHLAGPLDSEKCPLVLVPSFISNALNSYFGDVWIPLFKKWFNKNTGLSVKKVDLE